MIRERKFASAYSSFWRFTLPFSESYVRHINEVSTSYLPAYQLSAPPERSALVSEMGFRYFSDILSRKPKHGGEAVDLAEFERTALEVWNYIKSLSGSVNLPPPSEADHREALILAERIRMFFANYESGQIILPRPKFPGCGLVENCEGDVLAGSVLYEIKNVERDFRSVDLRQLLTYCSLNYLSYSHFINAVGLLNPRMGVFFRISVRALCSGMAGTSEIEVVSEIVSFLSADQVYL